jgi:hypothetical protein
MPIKPIPSIHVLAALLAAAILAACANPRGDQNHGQHHPGQSATSAATVPAPPGASSSQGSMMGGPMTRSHGGCSMMGGGRAAPGGMQHMDKEAMCSMYRSMRDAPSEQERRTMMERNMQSMSPEMRERHLEMMRQECQ